MSKIVLSYPTFTALEKHFKKICSNSKIIVLDSGEIIVIISTFGEEIQPPQGFKIVGVCPNHNVLTIRLKHNY